jgi:hypothetical protein
MKRKAITIFILLLGFVVLVFGGAYAAQQFSLRGNAYVASGVSGVGSIGLVKSLDAEDFGEWVATEQLRLQELSQEQRNTIDMIAAEGNYAEAVGRAEKLFAEAGLINTRAVVLQDWSDEGLEYSNALQLGLGMKFLADNWLIVLFIVGGAILLGLFLGKKND